MLRKLIFPITLVIALSIFVTLPALADDQTGTQPTFEASNYCVSCHSVGDARLEQPTVWVGGVAHNSVSPCPAASQIQEEIYYTERLMLAIDRAGAEVPANVDLSKTEARLASAQQAYSRLLDAPVDSLDAFSTDAAKVRYSLGKVYTAINQNIESAKRARVLWWSVGATAAILISLVWGWDNARKAIGKSGDKAKSSGSFSASRVIIVLIIFAIFAMPIFRVPEQPVEASSEEEQERQTTIDETARAALTADRELSRAWMLAKIGALYADNSPDTAQSLLNEALLSAEEAQNNQPALWGLSQAALEAGRAKTDMQAKADLAATELDASRGRAWALRLIAEEWMDVDAEQASAVLEQAVEQASLAVYPYDQLDLRAIAVTWAKIDQTQGVEIAKTVSSPSLRSWALREIAVNTGDDFLFDAAAEAAREVDDPVQRARVLREVAVASGNSALFAEAAAVLESAQGVEAAYAMAELAGAVGDIDLATKISSEYPAAVALAYYHLEEYGAAWKAASQIADPLEKARAQAAIAAGWGNTDIADQIHYALLRDRALRDISIQSDDLSLVEEIEDPYYQVQALTAGGEYEQAWQIAADLDNGFPLAALGAAWAESDPQAAAQVLEELTLETDKAVVLLAIASATGDAEDYESALGMALAARTSGDALAPVNASLELANAFSGSPELVDQALQQAYDIVQTINIIYQ